MNIKIGDIIEILEKNHETTNSNVGDRFIVFTLKQSDYLTHYDFYVRDDKGNELGFFYKNLNIGYKVVSRVYKNKVSRL